jgi:hypothetical protein
MFTCLCIPTHKRTRTRTHKYTHMHIQSYMHTYIDQYPYTYVYVYAHIQSVYMYMCIYTCISTHLHMHVYILTHTHTYTCACIGVEMFAWGRFVDTGGRACLWKCQRVGFEPWSIWRTGAAGVACDAVCLHMWVYDPNTSKFALSIMCAGLEVCGSCECLCMCAHMCLREREYTSSLTHAHTEGKIRQGARPLAPCSWQTQTHTHTHTHTNFSILSLLLIRAQTQFLPPCMCRLWRSRAGTRAFPPWLCKELSSGNNLALHDLLLYFERGRRVRSQDHCLTFLGSSREGGGRRYMCHVHLPKHKPYT